MVIPYMQRRRVRTNTYLNHIPISMSKTIVIASVKASTNRTTQGEDLPYCADKQLLCQREQHLRTHNTRNRACAIKIREALLREPFTRCAVHIKLDASL